MLNFNLNKTAAAGLSAVLLFCSVAQAADTHQSISAFLADYDVSFARHIDATECQTGRSAWVCVGNVFGRESSRELIKLRHAARIQATQEILKKSDRVSYREPELLIKALLSVPVRLTHWQWTCSKGQCAVALPFTENADTIAVTVNSPATLKAYARVLTETAQKALQDQNAERALILLQERFGLQDTVPIHEEELLLLALTFESLGQEADMVAVLDRIKLAQYKNLNDEQLTRLGNAYLRLVQRAKSNEKERFERLAKRAFAFISSSKSL